MTEEVLGRRPVAPSPDYVGARRWRRRLAASAAAVATVAAGLAVGGLAARPAAATSAATPVQPWAFRLYNYGDTNSYAANNYATVDFGGVQQGAGSTRQVVIQATGVDTVAVPAIATTSSQSPNSGDFAVAPDQATGNSTAGQCFPDPVPNDFQPTVMDTTSTLGPSYCVLDVTFTPTSTSAEGAELAIRDTAGNLIGMFFLTGAGTAANATGPTYSGAIPVTAGNAVSLNDYAYQTTTCYTTFAGTGQVTWGDGASEAPVYRLGPSQGFYYVDNSHTYATPGLYFLTDTGSASQEPCANTYSYSHVVVVSPGTYAYGYKGNSPNTDLPLGATGAENSSTPITLAYFSDTDPIDTPANFSVAVNWGDGTSSTWSQNSPANAGDITLTPDGTATYSGEPPLAFVITGFHTYAEGGSYTPTVHVTDAWTTVVGTEGQYAAPVTVADSAITPSAGPAVTGSANSQVAQTLLTFTDADTSEAASHYQASVDWGDGTAAAAAPVVSDPSGVAGLFDVNGSHTYAAACSCTVSVTLTDPGTTTPITETLPATIKGAAPAVTLSGTNLNGTQSLSGGPTVGVSFSGSAVADPAGTNDPVASWTLDFGDGSAPITGTDPAALTAITHTYNFDPAKATNGADTYSAVLTATDAVGSTGTSSTVPVTVTGAAPTVTITPGSVTGIVPTPELYTTSVSDPNPGATIINWSFDPGDGSTPQTGTGTPPATINYTYNSSGMFGATLTVTDSDGITGSGSAAPVLVSSGLPGTGGPGGLLEPTTVTVTGTPESTVGQYVFTATVTPVAANGSSLAAPVGFADGTTPLFCTGAADGTANAAGVATCTVTLGGGAHQITASYAGNAVFMGSTSPPYAVEVIPPAGVTLNPPTGVAASFTGTTLAVTWNAPTDPTGITAYLVTVAQIGGTGTPTTVPVAANGPLMASVANLDPTASYSVVVQSTDANGDLSDGAATGANALVNPPVLKLLPSTTTTVTAAPGASAGTYTIAATVGYTPVNGTPAPTGRVAFFDGTTPLACAGPTDGTLSAGVATCTVPLAPGQRSLMADYLGDADYAPSESSTLPFTVPTTTGGGGGVVIPPVVTGGASPAPNPAPAPPPAGSGGMVTAPVGSTTVGSTTPTALAGGTGGGNAAINVPAGALPQGTTITIYSTNPTGVSTAAPTGSQLVASFGVSWQTPTGGAQDATAPITLTFTDPSIKAGDVVYEVGPPQVKLGTASADGTVTFAFSNDPVFMVTTPPPAPPVTRVAGADRDATAVAVSDADFAPQSAGAVVLARNDDYPDALAGGPLAAASNGPLLLTAPGSLDPSVATELARVLPKGGTVYLLGGTSALSAGVEAAVTGLGFKVVRLAGPDRYSTAAAIAAAVPGATSVFEVTGSDFADAVTAVPAAVANHGVVLLTNGATQSAATAAWLATHGGVTRYAVGGPAAQADPTAAALSGSDRYATAAAVAARFFPAPKTVGVATGAAFPDALAAGPALGGPMLLLPASGPVPAPESSYLSGLAVPPTQLDVYGGTAAVSDAAAAAVDGLL